MQSTAVDSSKAVNGALERKQLNRFIVICSEVKFQRKNLVTILSSSRIHSSSPFVPIPSTAEPEKTITTVMPFPCKILAPQSDICIFWKMNLIFIQWNSFHDRSVRLFPNKLIILFFTKVRYGGQVIIITKQLIVPWQDVIARRIQLITESYSLTIVKSFIGSTLNMLEFKRE